MTGKKPGNTPGFYPGGLDVNYLNNRLLSLQAQEIAFEVKMKAHAKELERLKTLNDTLLRHTLPVVIIVLAAIFLQDHLRGGARLGVFLLCGLAGVGVGIIGVKSILKENKRGREKVIVDAFAQGLEGELGALPARLLLDERFMEIGLTLWVESNLSAAAQETAKALAQEFHGDLKTLLQTAEALEKN